MYGGFIFRIGCLGEKKKCDLHDFLCIFARNRMTPYVANVHGNHLTSTYFILSRLSDRLIFRNSLSLSLILEKKLVRVTAHYWELLCVCQRA